MEITKLNLAGDTGPSSRMGTLFKTSEDYLGGGVCEAQALGFITHSETLYFRKSAAQAVS